jgi:hypothetical protein
MSFRLELPAMNPFETTATVQDQGQLHLAGVPFAPGTQVEVTVVPTQNDDRGIATAPTPGTVAGPTEDIFAEMRPFMVDAREMDDSREAIYTRLDGE